MAQVRKPLVIAALAACMAFIAVWKAWSCSYENYQIAPTISAYPERHAVKTLRELLEGSIPTGPEPRAQESDMNDVLDMPKAEALKELDAMLADNRYHDYSAARANYLWDMRDLVIGEALQKAPHVDVAAYVLWRQLAASHEKKGLPPAPPDKKPDLPNWLPKNEQDAIVLRHAQTLASAQLALKELDDNIAGAPPALLPHWLVVRGGVAFRNGLLEEAEKSFKTVTEIFPRHPRAETAAFMLARIAVEGYRREPGAVATSGDGKVEAAETVEALKSFQQKYPKSRYAAEVDGWLGAVNQLEGSPWSAISSYLNQLDHSDHPEIIKSACREIENCFKSIVNSEPNLNDSMGSGDQFNPIFKELAKRPAAAMRVIYFLLDGAATVDLTHWPHSGYTIEESVDETRQMISRSRNSKMFGLLARAVAQEGHLYNEAAWKPKFLAILAWAATEDGEHAQAIALCEKSAAFLADSDDLQLVHGVALQRTGRFADAVTAYRTLREKFPRSPLTKGLAIRLAESLRQSHHPGLAVAELGSPAIFDDDPGSFANDPDPLKPGPTDSLDRSSEASQRSDVILWCAPLEELAADYGQLGAKDHASLDPRYRTALRTRYLMREDFEKAQKFIEPDSGPSDVEARPGPFYALREAPPLRVARWEEIVQPIAELHARLNAADDPAEKARMCWEMALLWEKGRGLITMPAMATLACYRERNWENTLALRQNALAIGYKPEDVARELDAFDELSKTLSWSLRAADLAKGAPLAAQALLKANECLRRMSELSPYQQARAFETNAGQRSRDIYDRLQREYPGSAEAKHAMWFSFHSPLETEWMPDNGLPDAVDWDVRDAIAGARPEAEDTAGLVYDWERGYDNKWRKEIQSMLHAVDVAAQDADFAGLKQSIAQTRQKLQPAYSYNAMSQVFNLLDDFELLASRPKLEPKVVSSYIQAGIQGLDFEGSAEEKASIADFLAYQQAVKDSALRVSNYKPEENRWTRVEGVWREFIADYPASAKGEAAAFQLARSIVRQHRQWAGVVNYRWPDSPYPGEYVGLAVTREKPFDAARAGAALDGYEKAYPKGRYLADIRLLRGGAAIDAHDYATAMRLLCDILDDPKHRELYLDAALNLAQCFELLHEPDQRRAVVAALVENAAALRRFHAFAHSKTCGSRLLLYEGFIVEVERLHGSR